MNAGHDPPPLDRDPHQRAGHIEDPRVRELADSIIEAQRREIEEMKTYIEDLESR